MIAVCLIKLPMFNAFCYIGNRAIVWDHKVTEIVTHILYQCAGIVNVFQVVCQNGRRTVPLTLVLRLLASAELRLYRTSLPCLIISRTM